MNNMVFDGFMDIQFLLIMICFLELIFIKGILFIDGNGFIVGLIMFVDDDFIDVDVVDLVCFVIMVENFGGVEVYDVMIIDFLLMGLIGCIFELVVDGFGIDYIGGGFIFGDFFLIGFVFLNNVFGVGVGGFEENDENLLIGGSFYFNDMVFVIYSCDFVSMVELCDVFFNIVGVIWIFQLGVMFFVQVIDDVQIMIVDLSIDKICEDILFDFDILDGMVQIGELIEYQVVVMVLVGMLVLVNFND